MCCCVHPPLRIQFILATRLSYTHLKCWYMSDKLIEYTKEKRHVKREIKLAKFQTGRLVRFMYHRATVPPVCREDRLMIQSHGFDFSQGCASGLFHTFPLKSDMTEILLKGRRSEIIHLFSFSIVKITTTRTSNLDLSHSRLTDFQGNALNDFSDVCFQLQCNNSFRKMKRTCTLLSYVLAASLK